jgi:hypothetical protein
MRHFPGFIEGKQIMAIITLNGEVRGVDLDTGFIDRVRAMTEYEISNHEAGVTRVDYTEEVYVKDTPQRVMDVIGAANEGGKFGKLTMKNGEPVWFRGGSAVGPVRIAKTSIEDGLSSALRIGGRLQFVVEKPARVKEVIEAAGGSGLPPIDMEVFSTKDEEEFTRMLSTSEVWDFDVPELRVKSKVVDR